MAGMRWLGRALFWVLFAGYGVLVAWQATHLPARVPAHLGADGAVDRWGSLSEHLALAGGLGVLMLLLGPGSAALLRVLPRSAVNLPHPEYWKTDAHWPEAVERAASGMDWFASALAAFMLATMAQIGDAALGRPWPAWVFPLLLAAFLLATLAFSLGLLRRFALPPDAARSR